MSEMRICLAATSNFRHPYRAALIRELCNQGHRVYFIAPRGKHAAKTERLGATFVPWNVKRRSINPFREFIALVHLICIFRRLKPDLVHQFEHKACIYGMVAAAAADVSNVVCLLPGLGVYFGSNRRLDRALRRMITWCHRFARKLRKGVVYVVQNGADAKVIMGSGIVDKDSLYIVPSGTDTEYYSSEAIQQGDLTRVRSYLGLSKDVYVVGMISRLLWQKGVGEYVECARRIKTVHSNIVFLLAGGAEKNRQAVCLEVLRKWNDEGAIRYMGERNDVREIAAICDILVVPTYYPEGVPGVLLEACALGKAIVATRTAGCSEVIQHMRNGVLVSPKCVSELASAIGMLVSDEDLRWRLGVEARRTVRERFDCRVIAGQLIHIYGLIRRGSDSRIESGQGGQG